MPARRYKRKKRAAPSPNPLPQGEGEGKKEIQMKNKLIKILIPILCLLIFGNNSYAETEGDVIVVTNVPYSASVTQNSSTDSVTMDPFTGVHSGLSTVFTLQSNGGDEHFDYIIKSYIDVGGDRVSAYGDDGRLLFAHTTNPPTLTAVANAKSGTLPSKNVFAYPTQLGWGSGYPEFKINYKDYGNCYAIFLHDLIQTGVTHIVNGTPSSNTYEMSVDEAGSYRSTIEFTIVAK